jgi:hypothetical protein
MYEAEERNNADEHFVAQTLRAGVWRAICCVAPLGIVE